MAAGERERYRRVRRPPRPWMPAVWDLDTQGLRSGTGPTSRTLTCGMPGAADC